MTNQFSTKVSEILAFSREEAARLSSTSVGPEHLLLGMMRMKDGAANSVFRRLQLNTPGIKQSLEQKLRNDNPAPQLPSSPTPQLSSSPDCHLWQEGPC